MSAKDLSNVGVQPAAPQNTTGGPGESPKESASRIDGSFGSSGGGTTFKSARTLQTAAGRQALHALAVLRTTKDRNQCAWLYAQLERYVLELDAPAAAHARLFSEADLIDDEEGTDV